MASRRDDGHFTLCGDDAAPTPTARIRHRRSRHPRRSEPLGVNADDRRLAAYGRVCPLCWARGSVAARTRGEHPTAAWLRERCSEPSGSRWCAVRRRGARHGQRDHDGAADGARRGAADLGRRGRTLPRPDVWQRDCCSCLQAARSRTASRGRTFASRRHAERFSRGRQRRRRRTWPALHSCGAQRGRAAARSPALLGTESLARWCDSARPSRPSVWFDRRHAADACGRPCRGIPVHDVTRPDLSRSATWDRGANAWRGPATPAHAAGGLAA